MVKLVKLFVVLAFLSTVAYGQEGGTFITFNTSEHDFGTLEEFSPPLSYTFRFLNASESAVELAAPVLSCSCLTAHLSPRRVEPGQTGEVEVVFSPSGAAFRTYRTVDIYSRSGEHLQTLTVSAYVEPSDSGISDRYPVILSDAVRASRTDVPFGYVYWGESAMQTVRIANTSDKPVFLRARVSGPSSSILKVSCPGSLAPGTEDMISLEYRLPALPRDYSSAADTVRLEIAGKAARQDIVTSYILMGRLPAAAPGGSPSMRTYPSEAELSKALLSGKYSGIVELSNDGPGRLVIFAVKGDAETNLRSGTIVEPGDSFKVKARSDKPSFRLELFTNDPVRPYKELIFKY